MTLAQRAKLWAVRFYHVDEHSKATDIALLVIRIAFGVCLFYHHGAEKFYAFDRLIRRPLDPIGLGVVPSVIIAGLADGVCTLLIAFGLFSRYAAFGLLVTLNTVFWVMRHGVQYLLGASFPVPRGNVIHTINNDMNVPLYILGFLVVFLAGPGRYSLDKMLETRMRKKSHAAVSAG